MEAARLHRLVFLIEQRAGSRMPILNSGWRHDFREMWCDMITSGKYQFLYKYLVTRYADRVVLTFGQIEDLLVFSLPAPARADSTWWMNAAAETAESRCSDAWTLAHRTASPNLAAGHVVFERIA